jgi:hypothetical protein
LSNAEISTHDLPLRQQTLIFFGRPLIFPVYCHLVDPLDQDERDVSVPLIGLL